MCCYSNSQTHLDIGGLNSSCGGNIFDWQQSEFQISRMTITILIVDDDTLSRTGIRHLLSRVSDFEVVGEAENGMVAIDLVSQLHPNVVLMDLTMPIMNGIETAKVLMQKNQCKSKVVMLTGCDREEDIYAALAAGAHGYCLKDSNAEKLCTAIRSVAVGDIWLDAAIADQFFRGLKSSPLAKRLSPEHSQSIKKTAPTLSTREVEVVALLVHGLSNQEIADKLVIGKETVKTHIRHIMEKLAVTDRTQAAVRALKDGLISS